MRVTQKYHGIITGIGKMQGRLLSAHAWRVSAGRVRRCIHWVTWGVLLAGFGAARVQGQSLVSQSNSTMLGAKATTTAGQATVSGVTTTTYATGVIPGGRGGRGEHDSLVAEPESLLVGPDVT